MTSEFASIELARLYESQGYLDDALAMYKVLADQDAEGNGEILAAVARLESALKARDEIQDDIRDNHRKSQVQDIADSLAELNAPEPSEFTDPPAASRPESKISRLLEQWLMLMIVQKRLKLFKAIRARL